MGWVVEEGGGKEDVSDGSLVGRVAKGCVVELVVGEGQASGDSRLQVLQMLVCSFSAQVCNHLNGRASASTQMGHIYLKHQNWNRSPAKQRHVCDAIRPTPYLIIDNIYDIHKTVTKETVKR